MTRPLRLEFEKALYHVTSRSDRREPNFDDDGERLEWLTVLADGLERFHAIAYAYCLMSNHCHVVIRTHRPNLSRLMHHVNSVYTLRYIRRLGKVVSNAATIDRPTLSLTKITCFSVTR